jgi:TonB-dependent starch-binding outer membrane protein SusC
MGWDFDLSHKNIVGDFSYSVSVNLSLIKNKVASLSTVSIDIAKGLFVGYPINSVYGYVADGIFVDQADVDKYPKQPFKTGPGQIRLKDISGPNGVPDGKVDATYDRKVLGSPLPTSTYGVNMSGKYKGFDLDILFQGEGGRKAPVSSYYSQALSGDGNIQQWQFDERWTPQNPNPNAGYPRMYFDSPSDALSTFWIENATFLRLKNIQIGYNLPSRITKKLSIGNVRFYVNGENLFTLSHFDKGWDPEMQINQTGWYPLTRLWLIGVNVNF